MLTPAKSSRVGLVESNPSLAERYSLLGAVALVTISDTNTIPFRVINPTSQPVTIYRRTNLGHISLYQQPPAVSVIDTNQTETPSTSSTIGFDFSYTNLNEEQQAQLVDRQESNRDMFATTDHELDQFVNSPTTYRLQYEIASMSMLTRCSSTAPSNLQ